ncbi:MAG: hypothetical protein M3505_02540, partial [Verrucomicrobiota bacterium]|nr:hypothetical protein [Verrucomicrobiota bacterium]
PGLVLLVIRLRVRAVEDVIGAEVHQPRTLLSTNLREQARSFCIYCEGFVRLCLTTIYIRLPGSINEHIKSERLKLRTKLLRFGKIELLTVESRQGSLAAVFAEQRPSQSATGTNDHDSHSVSQGLL